MRARRVLPTTVTLVVAVMLVGLTAAPVGADEDPVDQLADELVCVFNGVGEAVWNSDNHGSTIGEVYVHAEYDCSASGWFSFYAQTFTGPGIAMCSEGGGGSLVHKTDNTECEISSLGWPVIDPSGGFCTISISGEGLTQPGVSMSATAVGWCPPDVTSP